MADRKKIVEDGREKTLELLLYALDVAQEVMGGSGGVAASDNARIAACRFVLDMALKSPFCVEELATPEEETRAAVAARDAISELLDLHDAGLHDAGSVRPGSAMPAGDLSGHGGH